MVIGGTIAISGMGVESPRLASQRKGSLMEILAFIAFVAVIVFINRMIRKGVNAGVNGFINQAKKRL